MPRDEVFLETKVWITDYGYAETLHAFDEAVGKLGVERLDLLILHQALPGEFALTIQAYRALERFYADGKVRAIGVSNFKPDHLDRLLAETQVAPAVSQIAGRARQVPGAGHAALAPAAGPSSDPEVGHPVAHRGELRRPGLHHQVTAVQSEYSLWTRDPEPEVLPVCAELGLGFVPFSPLGKGFLTGTVSTSTEFADGDVRNTIPKVRRR